MDYHSVIEYHSGLAHTMILYACRGPDIPWEKTCRSPQARIESQNIMKIVGGDTLSGKEPPRRAVRWLGGGVLILSLVPDV